MTSAIRDARVALGVDRLVMAIHDQSFPSTPDEDIGRGSPYGQGARSLLRLVAALGFDGLQFGPQGDTSLTNPSPYDGALFSKSPLSIALGTLAEDPAWAPLVRDLLPPEVAARPAGATDRVGYEYAWRSAHRNLTALHARFRASSDTPASAPLKERFEVFRRTRGPILEADGLFAALSAEHGSDDWRTWNGAAHGDLDRSLFCPPSNRREAALARRAALAKSHAVEIDRHLFGQFVLHEQHRTLREAARTAAPEGGIALFGDLQIGFSHREVWSRRHLFVNGYLMGAPPSRTNPAGQPWGYPVLDPAQCRPGEPGRRLVETRVASLLDDFDGIRLDHPHGLVCPWVYDAHDGDPAAAVGRGARLRCSPNLSDHPRLRALAIPSVAQLSEDPGIPRYADGWVRELTDGQVIEYGVLFDVVMTAVAAAGRKQTDVVCEVLSTWPYPLRRVMERYHLGRFCVTQKADLARPEDVYRSENTSARDWIMVGNHDTPPLWALVEAWQGSAAWAARALYLAERLTSDGATRPAVARWIAADPRHLCHAMVADLFAAPARRVSMFFPDLFGMKAIYNRPGVVDPDNWTLRLPAGFDDDYRERLQSGRALNLPLALALALAARASEPADPHLAALGRRLLEAARALSPLAELVPAWLDRLFP